MKTVSSDIAAYQGGDKQGHRSEMSNPHLKIQHHNTQIHLNIVSKDTLRAIKNTFFIFLIRVLRYVI